MSPELIHQCMLMVCIAGKIDYQNLCGTKTVFKRIVRCQHGFFYIADKYCTLHGPLTRYEELGLHMHQECRERFSCHWLQRKPPVIDHGMHHVTCVRHVLWCMSGLLTHGENVPGITSACATRNFTCLARGPYHPKLHNPSDAETGIIETKTLPWLLLLEFLPSSSQPQPWYWPSRIKLPCLPQGFFLTICTKSMLRNDRKSIYMFMFAMINSSLYEFGPIDLTRYWYITVPRQPCENTHYGENKAVDNFGRHFQMYFGEWQLMHLIRI